MARERRVTIQQTDLWIKQIYLWGLAMQYVAPPVYLFLQLGRIYGNYENRTNADTMSLLKIPIYMIIGGWFIKRVLVPVLRFYRNL